MQGATSAITRALVGVVGGVVDEGRGSFRFDNFCIDCVGGC